MRASEAMSPITRCQSAKGSASAHAKPAAPTRRARRRDNCSRPRGPEVMHGIMDLSEDRFQTFCDLFHMSLGQLREERQRDRARRDVLADRELALAVAESLAVEGHEVDR